MEPVFKALADQTRRQMLDRLLTAPGLSLNELIDGFDMTRQSATRHISLLEQAGLISCIWHGRQKLHYLNPQPIAEIQNRWINKFSRHKTAAIDNLKQALEQSIETRSEET